MFKLNTVKANIYLAIHT